MFSGNPGSIPGRTFLFFFFLFGRVEERGDGDGDGDVWLCVNMGYGGLLEVSLREEAFFCFWIGVWMTLRAAELPASFTDHEKGKGRTTRTD